MKKLLVIVVFSLFWCVFGFAEEYWSNVKNGPTSENNAKTKFFKDRKLDKLEGIWFLPESGTVAITKSPISDNKYLIYLINALDPKWKKYNGTIEGTIIKTNDEDKYPMFIKRWTYTMGEEYTIQYYIDISLSDSFTIYKNHKFEFDAKEASKMWPLDYRKHNKQFEVKKEKNKKNENKPQIKFLTQSEVIEKYLSGRELEPIEGVWIGAVNAKNKVMAIYKKDENFLCVPIFGFKIEEGICSFKQGSKKEYYGKYFNKDRVLTVYADSQVDNDNNINLNGISISDRIFYDRLWPEPKKASDNSSTKASSSGSAFFVTNKGHIITNHHVVEGCNDQSKIMYKDKEYSTKLIASDKNLDLALLKADLNSNNYLKFSYEPKKMQKIYAAGYPFGKYLSDDLKFTDGIISSLKGFEDNTNQIQISAAINPGNSGGPVINQGGELVGVAVSGLDKGLTEGINFAIKSEAVKTFLTANKVKPSSNFFNKELKNDKLLDILEESTVYTFCN